MSDHKTFLAFALTLVLPRIAVMSAFPSPSIPSLMTYLLCIGSTFPASSSTHQVGLYDRATMQAQGEIGAFVHSLQLASSPAETLISKLQTAQDSNGNITSNPIVLACLVAQAALEAASVEMTPVNQTEADSNWSVALNAPDFQTLVLIGASKV